MVTFIIIILEGLWCIYNFFSYLYGLPYLSINVNGNFIMSVANTLALKWSIILGVVFVAVGILGIIFGKRETNNMSTLKWWILVLASVMSVFLIF